jgi:hypothetical protein
MKILKKNNKKVISILLLPSINCMITKLLEATITQQFRQHHGNLCFGRDMIHKIVIRANWYQVKNNTGYCEQI